VKPYFDATAGSPLEAYAAEAAHHRVFRLITNAGPGLVELRQ
jgi:hypothetical protein